jgi:RHS repeat-associated protein
MTYADGTFTTAEYDKLGRRTASIDQNGKRTEYRYDALGRLTGVKDALNNWTEYGYNEIGNLITQTDAETHTTQYEYDRLGRRTTVILPLGQCSTMTYDAVGNLKTTTDFNGKTTSYGYNALNRLSTKQFQDGSAWTFTYTPDGQQDIVTLLDSNQQIVDRYDYDYNERDWLIQRTDALRGAPIKTIGYGYDLAGNKTSMTTSSGTVNYSYDSRNRLDKVIQNGTTLADYDYNAVNNLTNTTFSNGTQEVRQYDLLNRLSYLENRKDSTILSSYAYTLDKVGNRTQITEQDGRTSNYVYDALYRLSQEKINDLVNGNRTTDFVYDKVGNRLGQTELINGTTKTTAYVYDANDRLLSETSNGQTTTYSYDSNGQTLSKQDGDGVTRYDWNDEGRLVGAIVLDANGDVLQQMEYRYNANGIRVMSSTDGVQTFYLFDEVQAYAQVTEEYDGTGEVQVRYVYGNDLINQTRGNQTTFYLVDGLGSTRLLTDELGNVVNVYDYEAFGETINQLGTAQNQYLFAGEQFDQGLGDYYLRDRFYDSDTGRFTRRDKYEGQLGEPLTLHDYLYAHSDPINLLDPSGKFSIGEKVAASVIAGILADLILPNPVNSGIPNGEEPLPPGLEKLLLEAVIGIVLAKSFSGLFKAIPRGGGSGFKFINLLPERLATELAVAARHGISPFKVGSSAFQKVIDDGETLKWAITEGGGLLMVPKYAGSDEIAHSVITGGKAVVAAGEAQIAGGGGKYFLLEITNHSGHFQPSNASLAIGQTAFKNAGIIVP